MSLIPLTDRREIRQALKDMTDVLRRNGEERRVSVGWRGGSGEFDVLWQPKEEFWALIKPDMTTTLYWCAFGTGSPDEYDHFGIVVEINPPQEGINRRIAGAFMRDVEGNVYLTHSGKVGGGLKGIGKTEFLKFYRGDNRETALWPDGVETEVIVIGRVDSLRLPTHIGHYVHEVERFKATRRGEISPPERARKTSFSPEFSGTRRPHTPRGTVESQCDHGIVTKSLYELLSSRGLKVGNDRLRDLYVLTRGGGIRVLFEVKTDNSTSSIYQAVGQLLFHGASETRMPKLVAVFPGQPNKKTKRVLSKLGIRILTYDWEGDRPVFGNLGVEMVTLL